MEKTPHPGFYGWTLLIVLWLVHFLVVGFCFYGPPVLFPYMIESLGWSRTDVALGIMVSVFFMGFSAPVAAWCVGRFGPRVTLCVGTLSGALGFFLTQFTTSVPLYILFYGVFVGAGWAFSVVIPVQTLITLWFNKRRGTAFGLVWSGGAIGGLIFPNVITRMVEHLDGNWQAGWLSLSAIMVLSTVIAGALVRNRPSDLGQHVDGIAPGADLAQAGIDGGASPAPHLHRQWKIREILRSPPFWLLIMAMVGNVFGWQIIFTQSPLHLADRGFSPAEYSLIYGLTIGLTVLGNLGAGALSDRIEPRKILLVTTVLGLAGSILFWFVSPDRMFTLAYPLFSAIAIGAVSILPPIFIGKTWGVLSFTRINALMMPITTVFNSLASLFAGAVYDNLGSYFFAIAGSWFTFALAFIAIYHLRPTGESGK